MPSPAAPPRPFAPVFRQRGSEDVTGVVTKRPLATFSDHTRHARGARLVCARGQASVEFVVLLPVILVVLAVGYQAVLAGQAIWEVRVAARAAARANSLGGDAAAAA